MTALKACTIRSTRSGRAVQTRARVRSVRAELSGIYENDPGYRDATQFSGIYIPGKSGMVGRYAYRSVTASLSFHQVQMFSVASLGLFVA